MTKRVIQLRWVNFYEIMDELDMEDRYSEFTEYLTKMFSSQFNTQIEIEWMD